MRGRTGFPVGSVRPRGGGVSLGWALGLLSPEGCLQGPPPCPFPRVQPPPTMHVTRICVGAPAFPARFKEELWAAASSGGELTPARLRGECRGPKGSVLLPGEPAPLPAGWRLGKCCFPPPRPSEWGARALTDGAASAALTADPALPPAPCPGSHRGPGSAASGRPHAPPGGQSPFSHLHFPFAATPG